LTDPADQKLVNEADTRRADARAAAKDGNMTEAAKLFVDFSNGQPGSFDALPPATKAMFVDNARTLLLNAPGDLAITCAQLEQLKIPVTITKGQLTKPSSRVITEAAHRCVPRSQLITIAESRHGASRQNPVAFNEALLAFLARN
jgi:pimeloyl-ACP methyl ester carboxylesterase